MIARTSAHVFIGRFDLPVPLTVVLIGAVAVVAVSFGLIYVLPPRPERPDGKGRVVPRPLTRALQTAALLYLAFLIYVGLFGRQVTVLNAATILFWVVTIPVLPLLHCVCGGVYRVANPFALLARLATGGRSARGEPHQVLQSLGYWPAVGQLFLLVWFELALRVVPSSPLSLGLIAAAYLVFQVAMGAWLGEDWYEGGDVFQAITSLASTVAPLALVRDSEGYVRLQRGFRPARFLPPRPGREALITLWLAGVLADGIKVTPIWSAVSRATEEWTGSLAAAGSFNIGQLALDTAEILFTWLAFGIFFWAFTYLAATLSRREPRAVARIVAPSLIPIALAYLFAHNLTQVLVIGPMMVQARDLELPAAAGQLQANSAGLSPPLVFSLQVAAIVLGHVVAVVLAHARLSHEEPDPELALRADLGWLAAMLVYTATSLWVIAQPITNAA